MWPAEKILSKSEIRVEFRLCSAGPAELDKACSDKTSVWWEGRALSGDPISIFCSTAEDSD